MAAPATILYDLAFQCDGALEELQELFASKKDDARSRLIRGHRERFGHWAGYLGVYAPPQASLDHRLETSSNTRDLVVQLLDILQRNIQTTLSFEFTTCGEEPKEMNADSQTDKKTDTTASEQVRKNNESKTLLPATQASLDGIRDAISWLHHLGQAIRETSKSTIQARVTRFKNSRPNQSAFFEHMTLLIVRGLYPHITDAFAIQLADSVSYRRQRLDYQRRHEKILGTKRIDDQELQPTPTQNQEITPGWVQDADGKRKSKRNTGPASVTEASEFKEPEKPLPYTTPYTNPVQRHSGPRTATVANPSNLYPPTPKVPETDANYKCLWCSQMIPVSKDHTEWRLNWRAHFKDDLEPYVCISEECSVQPLYFSSQRSWYTHMTESHTIDWAQEVHKKATWYCDVESHDYEEFVDVQGLREHLKSEHSTDINSIEIEAMVKRNRMYVSRGPTECPLCSEDILNLVESQQPPSTTIEATSTKASSAMTEHDHELSNQTKMMIHVVRHLQSLAFTSLRYFDTEDEDEKSSVNSHEIDFGAAADKKSSQDHDADHYFELEGSLTFEDIPPEQRHLDDDIKPSDHSADKVAVHQLDTFPIDWVDDVDTVESDNDEFDNYCWSCGVNTEDVLVACHEMIGIVSAE